MYGFTRNAAFMPCCFLCLFLLAACTGVYGWPYNTRPHTYAAALGDLDGDGDLDAFLANGRNEGAAQDTVWRNDGQGHFNDPLPQAHQAEKRHLALGDLDGDGDLDAMVDAGAALVAINDGRGNYTYQKDRYMYADDAGVYSFFPALGDLDGDGDLDGVLGGCCGGWLSSRPGDEPGATQYSTSMVWLNDGQGQFRDTGHRLGISGTTGIALGDLDSDGDLDIFAANSGSVVDGTNELADRQPNRVWWNDGRAAFTDSGQSLGREESYAVDLGDLDSDGDLDAFVGNRGPDAAWMNDGAGGFTDSGQSLGNEDTRSVALGDLDGDGDLDALSDGRGFAVTWLNQGGAQGGQAGAFRQSQRIEISIWYAFALGDLDGDSDLDLFAGLLDQHTRVWFNDGNGELKE